MSYALRYLLVFLLTLMPALASAQSTGNLLIQRNLAEIAGNGSGAQSAARINLGLGTMATQNSNNVNITGGTISGISITGITLNSPTFTGIPITPTPAPGTTTTQVVNAAFVAASFAPLASPALTGVPTAPNPTAGTSTTQIATAAFVANSFAPLASPTFSGSPLIAGAIPSCANNSTRIITSAWVATCYAVLTGATFSGLVTAPRFANTGSTITLSGTGSPSSSNSTLYLSGSMNGSASGSIAFVNSQYTDNVNAGLAASNAVRIVLTPGANMGGARRGLNTTISVSTPTAPGDTGAKQRTGIGTLINTSVVDGGREGRIGAVGGYRQTLTGLYGQVVVQNGARALAGVYGAEINAYAANSSVTMKSRIGVKASQGASSSARGVYSDAAFSANEQPGDSDVEGSGIGWGTFLQVGGPLSSYPLSATSTVLRTAARLYRQYDPVLFYRGIDFSGATITAGGSAFLSPNFQVNEAGALAANGISTTGTIQAYTASLTGITIAYGGQYDAIPSIFIEAPPAGGVQATVSAATMAGAVILGFGNTGVGFLVSETLTAAGGTGTAPTFTTAEASYVGIISGTTFTVQTVNSGVVTNGQILSGGGVTPGTQIVERISGTAGGVGDYRVSVSQTVAVPTTIAATGLGASGRITALALASGGAWSVAPANPIRLTGGSGTGAWINILTYDPSGGVYTPTAWEFAASGENYAVGDIVEVQGDTGTPMRVTVGASVTATGGMTFTAPTTTTPIVMSADVTTPGSQTALGTAYGRSTTTISGSGSGANLIPLYGIATTTITAAGSGYPAAPLPFIRTSPTDYYVANIVPTMTPVGALLTLNGAGGALKLGSGGWSANGSVATALSSVGPAGSHTTVQEWLTVTNASGVIRYIPAF